MLRAHGMDCRLSLALSFSLGSEFVRVHSRGLLGFCCFWGGASLGFGCFGVRLAARQCARRD